MWYLPPNRAIRRKGTGCRDGHAAAKNARAKKRGAGTKHDGDGASFYTIDGTVHYMLQVLSFSSLDNMRIVLCPHRWSDSSAPMTKGRHCVGWYLAKRPPPKPSTHYMTRVITLRKRMASAGFITRPHFASGEPGGFQFTGVGVQYRVASLLAQLVH